jgi:fumarate hydratase class II
MPKSFRIETDSMGEIAVSEDCYWGAQTQRALLYFAIGQDRLPPEMIRAFAMIKKAAALANQALGKLSTEKAELIAGVAEEIIAGQWDDHFPLSVWISGSGTQFNMNVNEVIANRAIAKVNGILGSKDPIHPNDHVNLSQSTNDVFPTAMQVATAVALKTVLLPAIQQLHDGLNQKAQDWKSLLKIGRTHLQDAVPLTLGQEFFGYVGLLSDQIRRIQSLLPELYPLAIGGTAVGTGLNAPPGFGENVAEQLAQMTGIPFVSGQNKFALQGSHDGLVLISGALKGLAVSLYKIANDIRLLACGPRAGLQELILPANEPGSSIMPGKVNPTQCEALTMVATQVMGLDAAVAFAGAGGSLEMNVYKPLIIYNILESIRLLAEGSVSFRVHLVQGLEANVKQLGSYLQRSLMLVTALTPVIGYDRAAQIAHKAYQEDLTLKEAALALGYISAEEFDRWVDPKQMV